VTTFVFIDGFDEGALKLFQASFRFIVLIENGSGLALPWFKDQFLLCNDRAALMRHSSMVRTLYSSTFLLSLNFAY
jgi:hypothetical protein